MKQHVQSKIIADLDSCVYVQQLVAHVLIGAWVFKHRYLQRPTVLEMLSHHGDIVESTNMCPPNNTITITTIIF